ncbi:MAG: response regulator [Spirochaetota bacterium]|nr:response regulator [Spirochaetota bacterium]
MYRKQAKILLVDDQQEILDLLEYLLAENYQIKKTCDSTLALEILQKEDFDLAIFDVSMPILNGFDLAKKMIAQNINIPFMFLTAQFNPTDKIQGLELGASDYIIKPFNSEELILRIRQKLYNIEKVKLRDQKLDFIHHEIVTPAGVVKGYSEILADLMHNTIKLIRSNKASEGVYNITEAALSQLESQFIEAIDTISQCANQLIRMSQNFTQTKTILHNVNTNLNLQQISLDKLFEGVTSNLNSKKVIYEIKKPIREINLKIDIDKISKVILELFDNSILHNKNPNVELSIEAKTDNNYIVISITDNGYGIKNGDFQKVFEEFWVGHEMANHTRGGGMGLFICKKYIGLHDGSIWVNKSEIGKGTTMSFSLPI